MAILPPFTVCVTGFGDLYAQFFNAVAALMSGKGFASLITLGMTLGGLAAVLFYVTKHNYAVPTMFILKCMFVTTLIIAPIASVRILDVTSQSPIETIDNVPFSLALLASLTSRIGYGTAELMDDVFHSPDDLKYTQSGMLFGAKVMLASRTFVPSDATFRSNLARFDKQCVFYDLLLHKYSINDLKEQTNIWQFVTAHASPARAFIYRKDGNSKIVTCKEGAASLSNDWYQAIEDSTSRYADELYYDNGNAKDLLLSVLPTTYNYFIGQSDTAAEIMRQNMMMNAIQDDAANWAAATGGIGGMSSAAFEKAQMQKREAYQNIAQMAVHWLPLLNACLQMIAYGMFVLVAFMLFFPHGWTVVKYYVQTLIWLQLWAPFFAMTNFILSSVIVHRGHNLVTGGGITLGTFSGYDRMLNDLGLLAGFLSMMVPFLAFGLFKGMASVFLSIAQLMNGSAQSLSYAAAGESTTGNLNLGNTQFDTHSQFNMNANHMDMNGRVATGLMSTQLSDGSTDTVTGSGRHVINTHGAISSLPVSIQMGQALTSTFNRMADHSQAAAMRDVTSAAHSYSDGLRALEEFGQSSAHTVGSGDSSTVSQSGAFSQAARSVNQLVDRFAHENHISHAEASRVMTGIYVDGHATASFNLKDQMGGAIIDKLSGLNLQVSGTFGGKYDNSHSKDDVNSELYNKAATFAKEHNFSTAIDTALRAAQDHNFRSGSEEANRLASSFANNFEQGQRFSQDAASSFEQADSYRAQASLAQSESVSINTQANQEFVDWMQTQPNPFGKSGNLDPSTISNMMTDNPEMREQYAHQFIQEKEQSYMSQFEAAHPASSVHGAFEHNQGQVGSATSVMDMEVAGQQSIIGMSGNTGNVSNGAETMASSMLGQARSQAVDTTVTGGQNVTGIVTRKENEKR